MTAEQEILLRCFEALMRNSEPDAGDPYQLARTLEGAASLAAFIASGRPIEEKLEELRTQREARERA